MNLTSRRQEQPMTSRIRATRRASNNGRVENKPVRPSAKSAKTDRVHPPKPQVLPLRPQGVPKVLRAVAQWVVWRLELRDGRWTKIPHDPNTGRRAAVNKPSTWASYTKALEAYKAADTGYDGIGFVFT